MKLTTAFILLAVLTVHAKSYSQQTQLSFSFHQTSIADVLSHIEEKSEFYFFYKENELQANRLIDINVSKEDIHEILGKILDGTGLTYSVIDRYVVISAKDGVQNQSVLSQQRIKLSGKVTDISGEPLPGVTVVIKGTTNGTITNFDGVYSLSDVPSDAIIQFSFVGMKLQEHPVSGKSSINVTMEEDAIGIEEVVAIGYGTRERQSMIGSISSVKSEKLTLQSTGNVSQALQGMAAGVTITNSNMPGTDAKIRIRGLGTINGNSPLWVIDGVPVGGGINKLSPSEIESITVLKDAASTAIYGARGASGVILVTTFNGKKSQDPKVTFNMRVGSITNTKKYEQPDPMELGEIFWLRSNNSGVAPSNPIYGSGSTPIIPRYLIPAGANDANLNLYDRISYPITEANSEGTDWYDEVYNAGVMEEYTMSISGGSEKSTYGFSIGYLGEDGMVRKTGFERMNLRLNMSSQITNWLEIGESIGLSHTKNWGLQSEGGINQIFSWLPTIRSIIPVRDVMGNWAPVSRLTGSIDGHTNILADLNYWEDVKQKTLGIIGNTYANITIAKGLSLKTLIGLSTSDYRQKKPLEANPESYAPRAETQLTESYSGSRQWNWTNTLNYVKTINDNHKLDILLGTEAINYSYENFSATRSKFLLNNKEYLVLSAGEGEMTNSGTANEWATMSYFGRLHYEYSNKYLFDATVRHDGSSRFGKGNRWGTFPAFAIGWRISNESFLSSTKNWLNHLKLRGSWGQSGNDQIGNYNGFTTFRTNMETSYYSTTGSGVESGFESLAFGNPDAKWETTTSTNFGLDAAILEFFNVGIDIWNRKTKDMLYPKSIPYVYGYAAVPSVNIGDMENIGFDIDLGLNGKAFNKQLSYNISTTISHYKNEITKLSDDPDEFIGSNQVRSEKGSAYPEFYGYIVDGIFQTEEEAANHATFGNYNAPGRLIFRDINGRDDKGDLTGKSDGQINSDDRTFIGSPHPKLTIGTTINIEYRGFDLVASLYASIGNKLANTLSKSDATDRVLYKSWGSPYLENNNDALLPMLELNAPETGLFSTFYLEDASYFRLQTLQLGYTFSSSIVKKLSMSNLRIYMMGSNLFTLTQYSGLDPSVTSTGDRDFGIDYGYWPSPKRFTVGLNLSF